MYDYAADVLLWKHLCPDAQKTPNISATTAKAKLAAYFDDAHQAVYSTNKELQDRRVTVLLIDEMDYLKTSVDVMYNFCNWPLKLNSKLLVIGISNTIDLLEQQMERSMSRNPAGKKHRMVFKPYSFDQMSIILHSRLLEFADTILDEKSIEFIARKAAQAGGDVRRALKICQR